MTIEAKSWFEAQAFRLNRLKREGKDVGQARVATERILWEAEEAAAENRIDGFFERRRRERITDSRPKRD